MIIRFLTVFICALLIFQSGSAQITDSIPAAKDTVPVVKRDTVKRGVVTQPKEPVKDSARLAIEAMPRKAAIRSAILPGLGQIYNGGLWWIKVPVIYGGLGTLAGIYSWNQNNYKTFLTEAQYRLEHNQQPQDPRFVNIDYEGIIRIKDAYRRDRDLTIIGMVGFYALNIIEAYVDAKFFRFDVSEDLALKVTPSLQATPSAYAYTPTATPTLKFSLSLGKPVKRFGLTH
ncbi:MAG TPA: DUF5683 domain-containing protein [Sphingobacteriaceae bacterium]